MSSQQQLTETQTTLSLPTIRIVTASPQSPEFIKGQPSVPSVREVALTSQRDQAVTSFEPNSRKRSASVAGLDPSNSPSESTPSATSASTAASSGTEALDQTEDMATRMSRDGSEASNKNSPSSPKKAKPASKEVEWSAVTDPEERRRIQNRIAQRKFREKARENKEKAERDSRNQQNAGNSYRIPDGSEFIADTELSGLPWGSVNFGHVVSRGHEAESRRSSGRGTYVGDESYQSGNYCIAYGPGLHQAASYTSSGAEEQQYYENTSYMFNQLVAPPIYPAA